MYKIIIPLFFIFTMTACSSVKTQRKPSQDMKVVLKDSEGKKTEAPAQATTNGEKEIVHIKPLDETEVQQEVEEIKVAISTAAQHVQDTHGKLARQSGPVSADKSLGWLKNGNTRFVKGRFRSDGVSSADRRRLAVEQRPHAAIFTCSDSRLSPELIFDQKLGEIFVVRTAEVILDKNIQESLEYAVNSLGSNLLVLLAAEGCADLNTMNAIGKDLLERSAILRDAVATGEVMVVKAAYDLEAGTVEFQ